MVAAIVNAPAAKKHGLMNHQEYFDALGDKYKAGFAMSNGAVVSNACSERTPCMMY